MLHHLKSFITFFLKSEVVEIESLYDREVSLSRILQLNGEGQVRAKRTNRDKILIVGAQHGARSNVLHLFKGAVEEVNGRIFLRGQIGLDPGIRGVLLFICLIVFFALWIDPLFGLTSRLLGATIHETPGGRYIGTLVLLGLLSFAYLIGKDDDAKIKNNLMKALHPV